MKIFSVSLGCAKNQVDSETLLGNLEKNGFTITEDFSECDLIFINTCGFIESAKTEAINTILECANLKNENQKLMVCGCLSTRYKDSIGDLIHEVDRFVTISEYKDIVKIAYSLFNQDYLDKYDETKRHLLSDKGFAYVKISEGCNNRCAYCAIPLIRGRFMSYGMDLIVDQVKALVKEGVYEINLISQDTTNYGVDLYKKRNIVELLEKVCAVEGNFKVRLLYFYPELVTDELIDYMAKSDKVFPYFDIPIQHSEDNLLSSMNRRGSKEFLLNLFKKIRNKIPHAVIRTTFIVGFPGETKEDVANLINFVKEVKFDRMGAFAFSKEEDTIAYSMDNQIDEDEKQNRLN